MNPRKLETAIQAIRKDPHITAAELHRENPKWSRTTAWRAHKLATETLEQLVTDETESGPHDNPGTEVTDCSQGSRVQGDTRGSRDDQATGSPKYSRPSKINDSTGKRVSRFKVEKVKTWLAENPNLKIVEVKENLTAQMNRQD